MLKSQTRKKVLAKSSIISIVLLFCCTNFSYADGPLTKLGRGLTNTATGWMEIPITMQKSCEKRGYLAGAFYGMTVGIVKSLLRTTAGVYETATFPLPFPNDYECVVEPEFVVESPVEPEVKVESPFEKKPASE